MSPMETGHYEYEYLVVARPERAHAPILPSAFTEYGQL